VILTSVEFDHADIYKDLDAVETAFKRLVNLVPRRGRIIAFDAGASQIASIDSSIDRCLKKAFCPVERYGASDRAGWKIANLKLGADRTSWSVLHDRKPWADFEFPLGGEYNVWNATAAAALAASYGISKDVIAKALATFRSVKRRLEVKAEINGITIIDDFAHHPTAIEQTIRALRARYPQSRLWVVLEPRSNTMRRNVLQDALARSLALADQIVVAAIFKSEAIPEDERLDLNRVIDEIKERGKQARIFADADAIVNAIAPELREPDVVAILSNGGFGGIYEKLPQHLRELGRKALGAQTLGVRT
jgi:UDP-N-acetylmuramate: L-alanyl-gamma-D-glutamyl-meso-diaminopimelate ligase